MNPETVLADFTAGVDPGFAEIVGHITGVLRAAPEPLDSAIKWRQLTFARKADFHHWICAVRVTKKAVVLAFHFGGLLDDPGSRFIAGSSRFGRKLEFRTVAEVEDAVVLDFVTQALGKLQYFKDNWKAIQAGAATG